MPTLRQQVIHQVSSLSESSNPFDDLEEYVENFTTFQLKEALLECGVIPEEFSQNSSEEKLCDILLALAFNEIGLEAEVLRARGNSADVYAKAKSYTLVSDGKAFRLSRTAKNQKDFKISSLNDWRKKNTYACLVAPLTQYPTTESQIYTQAVTHNVTLLSYTHLLFLVEHGTTGVLEDLWKIVSNLRSDGGARVYWAEIDKTIVKLCGKTKQDLENVKAAEIAKIRELGEEGIEFWRSRIADYKKLDHQAAIDQLIKAEKIESKIKTIKRAMS